MPLTHTKDLFAKALKGKYALGAFNVNNMELIQAIVEACEEEKAPLILQISKGARQYANPVYLKKLIEAAVSLSNIPIAVHLDHGDTFELCKQCIDEGFTSVMIDASHEPFEKNVEITKKVVEYAHKHNCSVESELGHLVGAQFDEGEEGGAHSTSGHYTNPDEAVKFVKETGCDSLAVAIGNSHGAFKFKGEQHLDLERLKPSRRRSWKRTSAIIRSCCTARPACRSISPDEINKYGGNMPDAQGVPEADIEVARRVGCTKVNIDTDLRMAMTAGIRKVFAENPKEFDPRKYMGPARTHGQRPRPPQGQRRAVLRRPRVRLKSRG
jgi:fructose-bisphosphate aldolase class II